MKLDAVILWTGTAIDAFGVAVIAIGIIQSTGRALVDAIRRQARVDNYRQLHKTVGPSNLLGLALLVAGDIIRTVAIRPTFVSVGVLVIIVLVRTFLSWTLEVELSGRFPWQRAKQGEEP